MIQVVPFEISHAETLIYQDKTGLMAKYVGRHQLQAVSESKMAYTGIVGDRVVFCGGVLMYWANRGEAWAIFGKEVKPYFIGIHNAVKRFLRVCPLKRVEATVYADFEAGQRWVKALGFKVEGPRLRSYYPDGRDATLYVRINERL